MSVYQAQITDDEYGEIIWEGEAHGYSPEWAARAAIEAAQNQWDVDDDELASFSRVVVTRDGESHAYELNGERVVPA